MKKICLLLLLNLFSSPSLVAAAAAKSASPFPLATLASFLLPLLSGNKEVTEAVQDSLNFEHARELRLDWHFRSIESSYHLRWGYKGAGDPQQPFGGVRGSLNLQLSHDGLTFQLNKSKAFGPAVQHLLMPYVTLSPCDEFYFKLAQLFWTTGQKKIPDFEGTKQALKTLVGRLKVTPGGADCALWTLPVLATTGGVGLETYLEQAPEAVTVQFVILSQKVASFLPLLLSGQANEGQAAYYNAILAQIDYFGDQQPPINLPRGGTLHMPFAHSGAGDPETPFEPFTITLCLPATSEIPYNTEWHIGLSAEQAAIARGIMLLLHHKKSPLAKHALAKEFSTLCARLSITPAADGGQTSYARSLLALVCYYHQSVINYSFQNKLQGILSTEEFLLQICRIAYHAYLLSLECKPQETADFVTVHLADALRWYEKSCMLAYTLQEKMNVQVLERNNIEIKWDLFFRSLLGLAPSL